jgi:hypothetical protein
VREYISGRRCRIRWSASVAFSAFSFAPPRRPLCIFVVVSTFPTLDRREPLTALSSCNTKGKRESAEGGEYKHDGARSDKTLLLLLLVVLHQSS